MNRLAVAPSRWPMVIGILLTGCGNSMLGLAQRLLWGRRLSRVGIQPNPLFIIGHWRCGTTLLHELLCLDPGHAYPNTYQCIAPHHFLLTEWVAQRACSWLVPRRRAMDAMPLGLGRPQEDEFALCNLGVHSTYQRIAFPNHPAHCHDFFSLEKYPAKARLRWAEAFDGWVKAVSWKQPGMLILKSPLHAFRIPFLLERFPDARFVHIVRDPYDTLPSTVHMWRSLYWTQGLQIPNLRGLDHYVFDVFERFHETVDRTRSLVSDPRFHELRFEDLLADPIGQMRLLYERLELGDFQRVERAVSEGISAIADYTPNRYTLSPELVEQISRRCGPIIQKHGYALRG